MNLVLITGHVITAPSVRTLPSGSAVWSFDLATPTNDGTASVPLAWLDPPEGTQLAPGDELVVLGSARRRFFRSAGSTQSRTEVVVEAVARAGDRRRSGKLIERAIGRLAPGGGRTGTLGAPCVEDGPSSSTPVRSPQRSPRGSSVTAR